MNNNNISIYSVLSENNMFLNNFRSYFFKESRMSYLVNKRVLSFFNFLSNYSNHIIIRKSYYFKRLLNFYFKNEGLLFIYLFLVTKNYYYYYYIEKNFKKIMYIKECLENFGYYVTTSRISLIRSLSYNQSKEDGFLKSYYPYLKWLLQNINKKHNFIIGDTIMNKETELYYWCNEYILTSNIRNNGDNSRDLKNWEKTIIKKLKKIINQHETVKEHEENTSLDRYINTRRTSCNNTHYIMEEMIN